VTNRKAVRASFDIEATSIDPEKGGVICISACKTFQDGERTTQVFIIDDRVVDPDTGEAQPTVSEQLRIIKEFIDFIDDLARSGRLFSYNGDTYDYPYLVSKAMKEDDYGDLVDQLLKLKQRHGLDLFKTDGKTPSDWFSLEDLCGQKGIDHDSDLSGEEIKKKFDEGKLKEIERYAKEDVEATSKLAERLGY